MYYSSFLSISSVLHVFTRLLQQEHLYKCLICLNTRVAEDQHVKRVASNYKTLALEYRSYQGEIKHSISAISVTVDAS